MIVRLRVTQGYRTHIQKCINSSVYAEIRTDVREIRPQIRVIFCNTNLRTVFLVSACFSGEFPSVPCKLCPEIRVISHWIDHT